MRVAGSIGLPPRISYAAQNGRSRRPKLKFLPSGGEIWLTQTIKKFFSRATAKKSFLAGI